MRLALKSHLFYICRTPSSFGLGTTDSLFIVFLWHSVLSFLKKPNSRLCAWSNVHAHSLKLISLSKDLITCDLYGKEMIQYKQSYSSSF